MACGGAGPFSGILAFRSTARPGQSPDPPTQAYLPGHLIPHVIGCGSPGRYETPGGSGTCWLTRKGGILQVPTKVGGTICGPKRGCQGLFPQKATFGLEKMQMAEAWEAIGTFIKRYNTEWLIERPGRRTPAEVPAASWVEVA